MIILLDLKYMKETHTLNVTPPSTEWEKFPIFSKGIQIQDKKCISATDKKSLEEIGRKYVISHTNLGQYVVWRIS